MVTQTSEHPVIALVSYHHKNTEKIAKAIAEVLDAKIVAPKDVRPEDASPGALIGFGSGIYGAKHHQNLLDLADRLPQDPGTRAFIFSTFGAPKILVTPSFIRTNHAALRKKLQSKGFEIVGEFGCAGWNTNSFLRYTKGLNRGRPNAEDLERARAFARSLQASG